MAIATEWSTHGGYKSFDIDQKILNLDLKRFKSSNTTTYCKFLSEKNVILWPVL